MYQVQSLEAVAADPEALRRLLHIFVEGNEYRVVGLGRPANERVIRAALNRRFEGQDFASVCFECAGDFNGYAFV